MKKQISNFNRKLIVMFVSLLMVFSTIMSLSLLKTNVVKADETEYAIKISIDTQNANYSVDQTKDSYAFFAVCPFPCVNDTKHSLKNNALGSWWNAWGETTISYEFYSPIPMSGMGGIGILLNEDPWILYNSDFTDEYGFNAVGTTQEYLDLFTNGWTKRTLTTNLTTYPRDIYLVFCAKENELPSTGVLEIYYKNFNITYGGNTYNLFGDENSVYNIEGVNCVANNNTAYVDTYTKDKVFIDDWTTVKNFSGIKNSACKTLGATFAGVEAPSIPSIEVGTIPSRIDTSSAINLLSYVNNGCTVAEIKNSKGETVDITGADFTNFVMGTDEYYIVNYQYTSGTYTVSKKVKFINEVSIPRSTTEYAIKISIDTQNENYSVDQTKDSYAFFAVCPFPCVNDTGHSLKNDALGECWNAWGETTISYEFYSPISMSGMAGIGILLDKDPWTLYNSDFTDEYGFNAVSTTQEYLDLFTNGWTKRTLTVNLTTNPRDIYLVFCAKESELPSTGILNIYFKNFTITYGGKTYSLFGNSTSIYNMEGVNCVANNNTAYVKTYTKERVFIDDLNTVKSFSGIENSAGKTLGATFKAEYAPIIPSINESNVPSFIDTSEEINLLSYVNEGCTITGIKNSKDEGIDIESADFSKFVFGTPDTYVVTYQYTDGTYTVSKKVTFVGSTYSVTFNTAGGSNVDPQTVAVGTKATVPSNPTLSGKVFVGWYTDDTYSSAFDFNTLITKDTVIYAKYRDYIVTFVKYNGEKTNIEVASGNKVTEETNTEKRTGYSFEGWTLDGQNLYDFDLEITSDITLTTKWNTASEKDAIHIQIDTQKDEYKIINSKQDDETVTFMVSPFPAVNDTHKSFKNDALGEWWNGFGQLTISYYFYSPTYILGMDGIGLTIDSNPWYYKYADFKNDFGDGVIAVSDDNIINFQNGWIKRTITINSTKTINDFFFLFSAKIGDLPTTGIIDMYYTDITISHGGNTYNIFGNSDSIFSAEGVNSVMTTGKYNGINREGNIWEIGDIPVDTVGKTRTFSNSLGAVVTAEKAPSLPSYDATIEMLYEATEYNLISFVDTTDSVEIIGISSSEGALDISTVDFTKYVFASAGNYTISYKVTRSSDGFVGMFNEKVIVYGAAPVFVEDDIAEVVPVSGYAHQEISIGQVVAKVRGEDFDEVVIHIKNSTGDLFEATEIAGGGWTFAPTNKKSDSYKVWFTSTNNKGTATSQEYTIVITDIDKPVIDLTGLASLQIGSKYTKDLLLQLVSITDISDGEMQASNIVLYDYLDNIVDISGEFRIMNSLNYKIVVTAKDTDDNEVSAQVIGKGSQTQGLVLAIESEIAQDKRASGVEKTLYTQIWHPNGLAISAGDVIEYDVMAYTVDTQGNKKYISGLGGITAQLDGNWQFIHNRFADIDVDSNGVSMKLTGDMSEYLSSNNLPVWYSRSYTVKSGDGIFGQTLYHFCVGFSTTEECSEKIYVYYRNVRVVDGEGTVKQVLWDGTQNISREFTEGNLSNGNNYVYATLDVSPVVRSSAVPQTANFNEDISISKNIMTDPTTDSIVPYILTIKDPKGNVVQYTETNTGYEFKVSLIGEYKVQVIGTNGVYSTEKAYTIVVSDNEKPSIVITKSKESYVAGEDVVITVTISDNVSSLDAFREKGCNVKLDGELVNATIDATATGYTISFKAEKGDYLITAYGTDSSRNETVESKQFTVNEAEEPAEKKPGCGSDVNSIAILLLLSLAIIASSKKILNKNN